MWMLHDYTQSQIEKNLEAIQRINQKFEEK